MPFHNPEVKAFFQNENQCLCHFTILGPCAYTERHK